MERLPFVLPRKRKGPSRYQRRGSQLHIEDDDMLEGNILVGGTASYPKKALSLLIGICCPRAWVE